MRDTTHIQPAHAGDQPELKLSAWGALAALTAALLTACSSPPPTQRAPVPAPAAPQAPRAVAPVAPAPAAVAPLPAGTLISQAVTPQDYRKDGARHLYSKNGHRIYKGKLPPLMHAVGVLQVDLDGQGRVRKLNWMRAPSHVPDVMREIERTVHAAAPFPAPVRMGGVTYTEVWLWDRSGNFQLDTLTEGQRSK